METKRTLLEKIQVDQQGLFGGFNRVDKQLAEVNATNKALTLVLSQLGSIDPAEITAIVGSVQQITNSVGVLIQAQQAQGQQISALSQQVQKLVDALPEESAIFKFFVNGKETTLENLTATQQIDVALTVTTKGGKPAKVDGVPVWSSSDEAVATVEAGADGMSAVVKAVKDGDGGVCQITVTGDADLGAGVKPITGFLDVTVVGVAAVFALKASAPTEQA